MEKKFYKGGAPKKADEEKRCRFVQVRFTQGEFAIMKKRKSTTKAKDMSTYIRSVCLEKPLIMMTQLETYQDVSLSLLREMRADLLRIGVNINQSSRRINSTTDYYDLQQNVSELNASVSHIQAQLEQLMNTFSGPLQPIDSLEYDYSNQ
jgi:hypothetical protein